MNGTAADLPVGHIGDLFSDSRRSAFARGKIALPATKNCIFVRLPSISHDFLRSKVAVVQFLHTGRRCWPIGLQAVNP
jgi:hypothetical protein